MPKTSKRHYVAILRGKKYNVIFKRIRNVNHLGVCNYQTRTIEIRPNLKMKTELDCIIHEALHACFPDITDEAIDESSTDITNLLIKIGYGKVRKDNKMNKPSCGRKGFSHGLAKRDRSCQNAASSKNLRPVKCKCGLMLNRKSK